MPGKKLKINSILFKKLLSKGLYCNAPILNIRYLKSDDLRFTVVVPKKISKKAVTRNKIKRRFSHIIKEYFEDRDIHKINFVVFVKQSCLDVKFSTLKRQVHSLFDEFLT